MALSSDVLYFPKYPFAHLRIFGGASGNSALCFDDPFHLVKSKQKVYLPSQKYIMGFDNATTLSGLFYIISTKDEKCDYETVLSWNHFWGNWQLQQPSFTPFSYNINNVFEYLEMFEVSDLTFYSHCKNNTMDLKLWEKKENSFKELLNIPIRLNPFFDTFSNPKNSSQFYKEKMPVASCTDWIDIKIGSTEKLILSAKIQVALAIGTPEQLNTFKTSRNITVLPCVTSKIDNPITKKANPTALADMLSTFIDNLALSLPKRSEADQRQQYSTDSRNQLRRTSDLLDVLHSALKNPAPVNLITSSSALPFKLSGATKLPTNNYQSPTKENIRVIVDIDSARNLTRKENGADGFSDDPHSGASKNDRLCTYASFEAIECDRDGRYSNIVTKTAQNSCNPYWNEKFNVMLPMELFQQNDKKFILKIWRKTSSHQKSHGSKHVDHDEIVGVAAIDLSPLSSESNISGHYNIVDAAGRINGQVKIKIVPTDDIDCQETSENSTEETELPNNLKDLDGSYSVDNIILSRTLKRKFTELEEISQRLKSRLLDVTTITDDNFDPEFENDLNTCPMEDDIDSKDQFDWNRFSTLEIDCSTREPETQNRNVDQLDFLANALKQSVLYVGSTDSNSLSIDGGDTSKNFQTPE